MLTGQVALVNDPHMSSYWVCASAFFSPRPMSIYMIVIVVKRFSAKSFHFYCHRWCLNSFSSHSIPSHLPTLHFHLTICSGPICSKCNAKNTIQQSVSNSARILAVCVFHFCLCIWNLKYKKIGNSAGAYRQKKWKKEGVLANILHRMWKVHS